MMRIGLLTSNQLSQFHTSAIEPIVDDDSFSIEVAIIDDGPQKSTIQKLKKEIKRGRGGYILIMAFHKIHKKGPVVEAHEFFEKRGIDVVRVRDPYSPEVIDIIKKHRLDILLLINGYGILKEPLLSVTPLGVLSYHFGNMRNYRGRPPAFWELYNGDKEMGITVQILAPGLDCGTPIVEKTIEIRKNDTLMRLNEKVFTESVDMMRQALRNLSDPAFVPQKIETFGSVYTLPNLRQWMMLQLKVSMRRISFFAGAG